MRDLHAQLVVKVVVAINELILILESKILFVHVLEAKVYLFQLVIEVVVDNVDVFELWLAVENFLHLHKQRILDVFFDLLCLKRLRFLVFKPELIVDPFNTSFLPSEQDHWCT